MATTRPTAAAMKQLKAELEQMANQRDAALQAAEVFRRELVQSERKRGEQMQRFAEMSAWLTHRVVEGRSSVHLTLTEVTAIREWLKYGELGETHVQVHPFARWLITPTPEEAYALALRSGKD